MRCQTSSDRYTKRWQGQPPQHRQSRPRAVPVKRSISQDHIVCLEDGKQFKALKRHLKNAHQMTPQQYRERWRLPRSYPMVAPNYAESSAAIAKRGRMAAASERRKQGAGGARQTTADC